MKFKVLYLPLLIILAGMLFTVYLQWQIPDGVYFSGDAGLKSLLAQQLSTGKFHFDVLPSSEPWIQKLWNEGLYPYEEPFVYNINQRYYITFPFSFPLVTALFYYLFGYRGLYLIPLASTWGIWLIFYQICRWLKFNSLNSSLALILLIFSSSLTIYSAIYWEHTLAVFLIIGGLAILFMTRNSLRLFLFWIILSGFMIGLSVWFRPEFLWGVVLIAFWLYLPEIIDIIPQTRGISQNNYKVNLLLREKNIWLVSLLISIGLFFICNHIIYGHYLGIHAIQIIEKVSLVDRLKGSWKNFGQLLPAFIQFFPITIFVLLGGFLVLFKKEKRLASFDQLIIILLSLLFIAGVSLIVPVGTAGLIPGGKQWGTRFLLPIIPIISLLAIYQLNLSQQFRNSFLKNGNIFLFTFLLVIGIYTNTYSATLYLEKAHEGIAPTLDFLKQDSHKIIAISNQFVAQVLEPALKDKKIFFKANDEEEIKLLASRLLVNQDRDFIYICYPHRPCTIPKMSDKDLRFTLEQKWFMIKFTSLDKSGKYPIYIGSIKQIK